MWVSHAALHPVGRQDNELTDDWLDEAVIAAALRPTLRDLPAPKLVVDGRAAAARVHSTSTYRLLQALDLPRAEPVACWSCDAADAWDALDLLLAGLTAEGCALLIAAGPTLAPWGTAVVWPRPPEPAESGFSLVRLFDRPRNPVVLAEAGSMRGHGFVDLVAAMVAGLAMTAPTV